MTFAAQGLGKAGLQLRSWQTTARQGNGQLLASQVGAEGFQLLAPLLLVAAARLIEALELANHRITAADPALQVQRQLWRHGAPSP